jgi:phenylacetate-CoA ligase
MAEEVRRLVNLSELVPKELADLQLERLMWSVSHAYENSCLYTEKLDEAGVKPEDIHTLDDVRRLPFTDKAELRKDYPFGWRAVPFDDIVRIHASSGTTGKKTVVYYTQKDIDDWADMFARCYEMAGVTKQDRVQITPGYGLWTAGIGFQLGVERLGAMAVPVGPGSTAQQLELMEDFGTTVITGTSSYGLAMAEEIVARGLGPKLDLRIGIFGSERWSEQMRAHIEEAMGVETFDIIGMTELYGPGTGIDCQVHEGIHYWADYFLFEIVDPATDEPVPHGEQGEIIATTLTKEAMPLLRYRTRDISRLIPGPCPCGSEHPRIDRILGRTDDMFKIHGVNIYPGQIDHVLSHTEGVGSEYQILLGRERGRDSMLIRVEKHLKAEVDDEDIKRTLGDKIKTQIGVTVGVELVDYQGLPRSEKKTRRVFDNRAL